MTTIEITKQADPMTDAAIKEAVDDFDRTIKADGQHFNPDYLWATAMKLQQEPEITDDAIILALALASLTKVPRYGCRATHKQIATRASGLRQLFLLTHRVGWARIRTVLGIESSEE